MSKRPIALWFVALAAVCLAVPASAQGPRNSPATNGGAGTGSGFTPAAGGSGGSSAASSGGGGSATSSGGGSSSMSNGTGSSPFMGGGGSASGVRAVDVSPRASATGGGGVAVGRAVHGATADHAFGRAGAAVAAESGRSANAAVPRFSRPRDGAPTQGTAVPRGSVPTTGGSGITNLYYPGYYGGYDGGYYDPIFGYIGSRYGYGNGYGYGMYDPWYGSTMMGGFYADPWYGGTSTTPSESFVSSSTPEDAALRLKIKPSGAEVFVDGYFVGHVDDFDGVFQKLRLESGAHRIEIRAAGYETLDIDVRLTSGNKTVYTGELKKIQ
ncbi:MAG TPA: PEGA domain-containing protein [Vicinamibacterales bacterium]|nr:PEGA domain-containing protein [Vicinamibacterales bacterium]